MPNSRSAPTRPRSCGSTTAAGWTASCQRFKGTERERLRLHRAAQPSTSARASRGDRHAEDLDRIIYWCYELGRGFAVLVILPALPLQSSSAARPVTSHPRQSPRRRSEFRHDQAGGWHRITLHTLMNGNSSSLDVGLDEAAVRGLSLTRQNLGTAPITKLQSVIPRPRARTTSPSTTYRCHHPRSEVRA